MWWAWQWLGGALQITQPRSRSIRASRIGLVTKRLEVPTSRGWELEPSTMGRISASQASRRTAAADRLSPKVRSPVAFLPAVLRSLKSIVTTTLNPPPPDARDPPAALPPPAPPPAPDSPD